MKENENKDIRWKQRYNNFSKSLFQLQSFIERGETLNDMEEQGMIKAFEYNFELAWNLIKDFYEHQGVTEIQGSRDAFRLAFNRGLIKDGENWMKMIDSRIKTSHTYNKDTADEIASTILNNYFKLFKQLHQTMEKIIQKEDKQFNNEK